MQGFTLFSGYFVLGISIFFLPVSSAFAASATFDFRTSTAYPEGSIEDLDENASLSITLSGITATISANIGILNQTASGFGINAPGAGDDTDGIDGVAGTEVVSISFSESVTLESLEFSSFTVADAGSITVPGGGSLAVDSFVFAGSSLINPGEALQIEWVSGNGFSLDKVTVSTLPDPEPEHVWSNYDDFNSKKYNGCKQCINADKWIGGSANNYNTEVLREIKGKRLRLLQRSWGEADSDEGQQDGRNRMIFRDSVDFSGVCFTPRIKKYAVGNCAANDAAGSAQIRYLGSFFDTDAAGDGDDGVVYAGIDFARRGDSTDKKGRVRVSGWASQCVGEACEGVNAWNTYDDAVTDPGLHPDLFFGSVKGSGNKKAACVWYDAVTHELVFSFGNDERRVNTADHGLPANINPVDASQAWHVIEARTEAANCSAGRRNSFVDGDVDNVRVRTVK